ncbi:helix-turn-helix transcriptional regulator [Pseudomonas mosselii]|uniref:helix-turn-helix transcriptional regulator n=1 Tax=Pseudomonas mosselii TaxID=78327 RepID=UPI003F2B28A1
METITTGKLKGHLGCGFALRELQCVLAVAQRMTAKEIVRLFGITNTTVKKRLSDARDKLGVSRSTALVVEAMKRQIISPMRFDLASLIAVHPAIGYTDPLRRDRRVPKRRIAQVRIIRRAKSFDLCA